MSKLPNIELSNVQAQTIAQNGLFNLGTITRKYCCTNANGVTTFSYNPPSNSISLNQCGYYNVNVNMTFTGAVAGVVTASLYTNGLKIPQASASETITTADTELRSMSFNTTIRVLPYTPVQLSIVNEGIEIDTSIVNVTITKII